MNIIDRSEKTEDGDIEWLHNPDYDPIGEEGLGYEQFISCIDTIVIDKMMKKGTREQAGLVTQTLLPMKKLIITEL